MRDLWWPPLPRVGPSDLVGPPAAGAPPNRCAAQLAQHIDPEEYVPLLVGKANSDPLNPLAQRVQNLQLLPHLLRGVKPLRAAQLILCLRPLLADTHLVCTQHTQLRAAVGAALEDLFRAFDPRGHRGGEREDALREDERHRDDTAGD